MGDASRYWELIGEITAEQERLEEIRAALDAQQAVVNRKLAEMGQVVKDLAERGSDAR